MLFFRYSNNFSRFSEAFIPLTLFEIKLQLRFMINITIKEIGQRTINEVTNMVMKNQQ